MIENDLQYRVSKEQLAKLRQGLRRTQSSKDANVHPLIKEAGINGIKSLIRRIKNEIEEYEKENKKR